jgi:hypothetical protein
MWKIVESMRQVIYCYCWKQLTNTDLFIYLLCFASKYQTIIALKKLGHHNSLIPITAGPLQNINFNIENRNN